MSQNDIFKQKIDVLLDRARLRGLLNDIYKNDMSKVNPLLAGYDIHIVDTIEKKFPINDYIKSQLEKKLQSDYQITVSVAEWVVKTWVEIIEADVIRLLCIAKKGAAEQQGYMNSSNEYEFDTTVSSGYTKNEKAFDGLFIPCGIGKSDYGFIIKGLIKHNNTHQFESIYAVVYNYLQRNTIIDEKKDLPVFIKEGKQDFTLDFRNVYRLCILLLAMVKNGYADNDSMPVIYDGSTSELRFAISLINDYSLKFCRLAGIEYMPLRINGDGHRISISLTHESEVYTIDYLGERLSNRTLWSACNIRYSNISENSDILLSILHEISIFHSFKSGQVEAITNILKLNGNNIHIMPTGSGKSLIFYITSLLQPSPSFIVCPTDLLIRDQIKNLKDYHRINDTCHLKFDNDFDFSKFIPSNKLIYLTPETFQNDSLLKRFITLNHDKKISAIVLDEIHCLSNWSHDFRPEYLMLSTFLQRYLDRTYFWGFTATANYTVVKDICAQLEINKENVFSPIELKRDQFSFFYYEYQSTSEMVAKFVEIVNLTIKLGQRTLVFTKNTIISQMLIENMGELSQEADVFNPDDPITYHFFAQNKSKVLIASSEIGIGINLPNVTNIIHFGLPISKSEYVQEIGRAGRNGERVASYIICESVSMNIDFPELLYRDTSTDKIAYIIANSKNINDYILAFRKIMNGISSKEFMIHHIMKIVNVIKQFKDRTNLTCEPNDYILNKRCLYILFVTGYIFDWCVIDKSDKQIVFLVLLKQEFQNLDLMKERIREYFYKLGDHRESISRVKSATSLEDLLKIYIDWFYSQFLYHHKEQFFDMIVFVSSHRLNSITAKKKTENEISELLASYFSLSILEVSEDETKFNDLSLSNISEVMSNPVEIDMIVNIERILSDKYSVKLDFAMFVYEIYNRKICDFSRIRRILTQINDIDVNDFFDILPQVYKSLSYSDKFTLIKEIEDHQSDEKQFLNRIDYLFRFVEHDHIFYGILATKTNMKLRRQSHARDSG